MFKSFISGGRSDCLPFDPELAAFLEESQEEVVIPDVRRKLTKPDTYAFLPYKKKENRIDNVRKSISSSNCDSSSISPPFLLPQKKTVATSTPEIKPEVSISHRKAGKQHPEITDITLQKVDVANILSFSKSSKCLLEVDGMD